MNRIHAIGRRIALLAGLVTALVAGAGALPAFAHTFPSGPGGLAPASTAPTPVYAVGGMPGWQIVLIAGGAAVVAAVVAVLVDRARAARRRVAAPQGVAVPIK
jgi:hypothetical protein